MNTDRMQIQSIGDAVKKPKHYAMIADIEAIELIAKVMSDTEFKAYCLGNVMKYRLRAGKKGSAIQDLEKANFYTELYDSKRHLCR